MTPDAFMLGDGRYKLADRLGAGGMASVWRAHDEVLDRDVAVKIIADTLAGDPQWRTRFTREARAAASITHPNVVSVFDFGLDGDRPYLVMEYIAGPTLAEALAQGRAIDPQRLADELLDAVAHVHAAGIVHRDIKPGNVLLDEAGSAHLSDFGIARAPDATALTQTGMVIGTLRYLAPEVQEGGPATQASDLYSTGLVIAEVAAAAQTTALDGLVERLTDPSPSDRETALNAQTVRLPGTAQHTTPTVVQRPLADTPGPGVLSGTRARVLIAAVLVTLLVAAVVAVATDRQDPSPDRSSSSQQINEPASTAPLREQLDGLDAAVDSVRSR